MTVAHLLKVVLFGELLIEAVLAGRLRLALAWPAWSVIALTLATWILVRFAVIIGEFGLARRWDDPRPAGSRPGLRSRLRCMVREGWVMVRSFSFIQPFPRLWAAWPLQPAPAASRPVVLLVHGFLCNASVWRSMRQALRGQGYDVETVNLLPIFAPVAVRVPALAERIEAICRERGVESLDIVAHSMGGLVVRAYAAAHGHARLARVITIATPHAGTRMARLAFAPAARDMRPGSGFLTTLAVRETPALRAKFVCHFSDDDNLVTPARSAALPGAREVAWSGIGHVSLIHDARVQARVVMELRAASDGDAVTASN